MEIEMRGTLEPVDGASLEQGDEVWVKMTRRDIDKYSFELWAAPPNILDFPEWCLSGLHVTAMPPENLCRLVPTEVVETALEEREPTLDEALTAVRVALVAEVKRLAYELADLAYRSHRVQGLMEQLDAWDTMSWLAAK